MKNIGIAPFSKIILRFDDYHQNIDNEVWRETLLDYNSRGLFGVIGVIPSYEGTDLSENEVEFLKNLEQDGWEIAQHGYTHENIGNGSGWPFGDKRSEFVGLSYEEQYDRIKEGKEILEKLGFTPKTFIPPWHEFDQNTLKALSSLEFQCLNEGRWFFPRKKENVCMVPTHLPGITPSQQRIGVVTLVSHPHLEDDPLKNADIVSKHKEKLITPIDTIDDDFQLF